MPRIKPSPHASRRRPRRASVRSELPSPLPTSVGERLKACAFIARALAKGAGDWEARPRRRRGDMTACLHLLRVGFTTIGEHIHTIRRTLPASTLVLDGGKSAPSTRRARPADERRRRSA